MNMSDRYFGSPQRRSQGGNLDLDQQVKGVPIQCIARVKPNTGF
jgi:hypothetical protein